MNRLIFVAVVVAALYPTVALADSDGYYCVGKGYLAFETHSFRIPNSHVLQVIQVSRSGGIQRSTPIPLDEFQVHGMTCRDNSIEVQGWTTRYSVDLSAAGRPKVTSIEAAFDPKAPLAQQNLGMLARPGVTDIPSDGGQGEFQLVIAQTTRKMTNVVEYYTISQIFQRDARFSTDHILASEKLFSGVAAKGGEVIAPPNTYQPSPRQERRSSPSGRRPKPKRRKSKHDR
jgi:hypothetical protein